MPATGARRLLTGRLGRLGVAIALVASLFGAAPAAPVAAVAGWYDGLVQYSSITNCFSIIGGYPYIENGAGVWVGYLADPDAGKPAVNETFYVHLQAYGLGNACAGQYVWPHLVLPPGVTLDISATNPVYCFAGGSRDTANCPQSLPYNAVYGGYSIWPYKVATGTWEDTSWPLPAGANWEWQIPVKASTGLVGVNFAGRFVMADGNASPTLQATEPLFVYDPTSNVTSVGYEAPSTDPDTLTRTAALSSALVSTGSQSGVGYFDLYNAAGTKVFTDGPTTALAAHNSYRLTSDWTPYVLTPKTTYSWRVRFVSSGGSTWTGAMQTFTTLGAATRLAVSVAPGATTAGTPVNVTVTAQDAAGFTDAGYTGRVTFSSTDVNAGLPADYTFTAADHGTKTWTLGVTMATAGTWTVRALDTAHPTISGTSGNVVVSGTASLPTASLTALAATRTTLSIPLAWHGANGAVTYDVRYRKAAYNGGFGAPVTFKANVTATSATFAASAGTTYCWSARSRSAGNIVSAWTTETCTSIPLDERSATKTGTWSAGTGTSYFKGTYLSSTALNAKLTRTGVQFHRLYLVATTCPTCGKVSVTLTQGTTVVFTKTVSLVSATTANKKVIPVFIQAADPTATPVKSGTLTIKVTTSGKKVLVDGIILSRYSK